MGPVFKYQAHRRNLSVSNYYYREGDDRLYKKIAAGITAPSEKPGAIVVVVQELSLKHPAHLFVVATAQEAAADNLLQKALDFRALYAIGQFYGRTKDIDFIRYLSFWNAERREKHQKTIEIESAPNSADGCISSHINALRGRLSPEKKNLHLAESELLPAAFQELSMSDVSTAKDTEHPILAALAYVVSALDEYADYGRDQPEEAEMEYDFESIFDR